MDQTISKNLSSAITAAFENAVRLLEDSQYLLEYGCIPTSYALSILAQEEFAKTFLLCLVQDGAIPWNANVHRALRNHTCKQLAGTIMEYLDAEWEKYMSTLKLSGKVLLPPHIADALNIIRHEKVPRANASDWLWDHSAPCNKQARRIADGEIDTKKQNALYVGIGRNGEVTSTPSNVTEEEAKTEFEKTKRLQGVFNTYQGDIKILGVEYNKISDAFRLLFGSITVEEYQKRW